MTCMEKETNDLMEFIEWYKEYENSTHKDNKFIIASWGTLSFVIVDKTDFDKHKLHHVGFGSLDFDKIYNSLNGKGD